jgi:hypothetical protein
MDVLYKGARMVVMQMGVTAMCVLLGYMTLGFSDGGECMNDSKHGSYAMPEYYVSHGVITDPKKYADLYDSLPEEIPEIVDAIQGLFLHIYWAERYGVQLTDSQKNLVQSRYVTNILEEIHKINKAALNRKRPLTQRFIGTCRDYAVFMCSVLRTKGIPARARCGFATYFEKNKYVDHWICEYWDEKSDEWIGVDAQLDSLQQEVLQIDFDPLNVPSDRFINGAQAWKLCREGKANPDAFGIFDMRGLWFVRDDHIRDLASLNKIELLPWDAWGLMEIEMDKQSEEDYALLDTTAESMLANDARMFDLYDRHEQLAVPKTIKSYTESGTLDITID